METKPETARETHAPAAIRTCKRPGCTTQLGLKNESGLCAAHFHWKGTDKRSSPSSSSAGNGQEGFSDAKNIERRSMFLGGVAYYRASAEK